MAKHPGLSVKERTLLGRKIKTLRKEGILPANIFGKKVKSQAVSVPLHDFQTVFAQVGETGLVDVAVSGEGKTRPCLIANVQLDPISDLPLHADFHQVDLTQKVTARVPVAFIGEAPAVKTKGAVLITLIDEIEVEALPTDLPDKFEVDLSKLQNFNDAILVKDLQVDKAKVEVKLEGKEAIAMVQEPKEEEVAPPPPAAPAEGEAPTEEGVPVSPAAEGEAQAPEKGKEGTKPGPAEKPQAPGGKPAQETPKQEEKK